MIVEGKLRNASCATEIEPFLAGMKTCAGADEVSLIGMKLLDELANYCLQHCNNCGQTTVTSDLVVKLRIDDINDNRPQFDKKFFSGFQEEKNNGTRETTIIVSATDADEGSNGIITYSVSNITFFKDGVEYNEVNSAMVYIDKISGLIMVKDIDYEFVDLIRGVVTATNSESLHPLSSSANFEIVVGDINDETPYFINQINDVQVIHVKENDPPGLEIATYPVKDLDRLDAGKINILLSGEGSESFILTSTG
eukprot:UC4_evm1s240